ncbi:MAG: hypothetical protein EPN55_09460 [Gammaproteobacteria bacterium]|nr:MAG: hypothetical protein EPN55_09460 [Gammaproteobacteria bacterium]
MAQRADDKRLDEYLRGDSPLTRAYRETGREEPSASLDARLLAEARGGNTAPRGGKPRWLMPLSLAATVVLSVGIVLFMTRQGATPLPPEAAPVVETPAPSAKPTPVPKIAPKETPRFEARDVTVQPKQKTPEQWLADIEELRKLGLHAEADEKMAEFRKRYPDYPLKR